MAYSNMRSENHTTRPYTQLMVVEGVQRHCYRDQEV
ncbi:predicted protein [Chaetomium globosum CBS 148.51]|uniref:Uncharacterized protein n=1 Tax=Chaetomium globosum (strain ATCC 6205 / CBS 148.51 / DSM 1962 / NBRC 6347 / NRRL 1970) TaxID=306901 RepID=Q2GX65_CHAGB|nr:uncharacterized protein CHGG_07439 [Chaetomium globosum CBS 148.51]EAQ86186.1 predicted protein [Chaetomium globosum CBS 148.51]